MSVVDLHPEELLDKDERGELTADERTRLDAHLARCSACRAEVILRADFAAELDGEDRPSELLGLVAGALAAPRPVVTASADANTKTNTKPADVAPEPLAKVVAETAPPAMPELDTVAGLRRRPRRTAVFLLVAAAVMAAGVAGATGITGRVWLGLRSGQDVTHPVDSSRTPSSTSTVAGRTVAPSHAPSAPTDMAARGDVPSAATSNEAPSAADLASATTDVAPVAIVPVRASAVPMMPRATTTASTTHAPPQAVGAATPAPMPTTATALFESANAARRDGDTSGALSRYDLLERQYPASAEARVAKATTGKLLLDRGDAAGALARFDAYLASGSPELREEAMAGRATALERLGRDDDELRAWASLLATYPGTPYAAHARARVGRSSAR